MSLTVAILDESPLQGRKLEQIVARDAACACVCIGQDWRLEWRRISHLAPDVLLMEVKLADGSGLEGLAKLKRMLSRTQILVVSACGALSVEALRAGASGYLLKDTPPEKLLEAIHEIKRGGVPMSDEVARHLLQALQRDPVPMETTSPLTMREREILGLLAEGGPSREIADRLSISVDTVNTHLKHIYGKFQVRSRTAAVIKYLHATGSYARASTTPRAPLLAVAAD
jgi:DNA-binding NarL/FixJ family response regulator